MAKFPKILTPDERNTAKLTILRNQYKSLADFLQKIIDGELIYCHSCGEYHQKGSFYTDTRNKSGYYPICKDCILKKVEQRKYDKSTPFETKDSVQQMLREMNLVYIDDLYMSFVEKQGTTNARIRSPFLAYMKTIKSLPAYKYLTWEDSEFGEDKDGKSEDDIKIIEQTVKEGEKHFGYGYSDETYMFLENEYQDWITRYECDTKAQENLFKRLAWKQWEIDQATRQNRSTKDLDKTYQDLLASVNLLPRQNAANALADSLTLGQLIEKWEKEKPIPEPEEEFKDVDGIGKYIRVWFKGHLARVLGIDNGYSKEYDEYIDEYTVKKPEYYEDGKDESIYNQIFGVEGE